MTTAGEVCVKAEELRMIANLQAKPFNAALLMVSCAALLCASAPPAEAANECQVSYVYLSGSGQSAVPQVVQTQVSANAIKTVNQGAMRYVVNDRDWPVDVEVTMVGGGTKWVHLIEKGDRDPANGNYIGNIELRKVKCLPGGTSGGGTASQGGVAAQSAGAIALAFFEAVMTSAQKDKQRIETLEAHKAELRNLKQRGADTYAGCPSAEAQAKYDGLKKYRLSVLAARSDFNATISEAKQALTACQQKLPASIPACVGAHAYATADFTGLQAQTTTILVAVDEAIAVMRSLKCVNPIDKRLVNLVANQ